MTLEENSPGKIVAYGFGYTRDDMWQQRVREEIEKLESENCSNKDGIVCDGRYEPRADGGGMCGSCLLMKTIRGRLGL